MNPLTAIIFRELFREEELEITRRVARHTREWRQ